MTDRKRFRRAPRAGTAALRPRARAVVEELEPRLLLSADVPGLDAALADPLAAEAPAPELLLVSNAEASEVALTYTRHELVVLDAATPELDGLLEDLRGRADAGRRVDVVVLDAARDGVAQLGELLGRYSGQLDAVHVISHGSDAALRLGSGWLDASDLSERGSELDGWRSAFAERADLLLYGCDFAASDAGRALVDALASATGADVAASEDRTGSAVLGGDWDLEYATGRIEAGLALSSAAQASFGSALETAVVDTTSDVSDAPDLSSIGALLSDVGSDGFLSLREAITAANNGANGGTPDEIHFAIDASQATDPDGMPGSGDEYWTIQVSAAGLPYLLDPVILDATTQTGGSGIPVIELDGSLTPAASGINGIALRTNDSTVKGFVVHSFADEGIEIDGSTGFGDRNVIQNNWVGIDATGALAGNAEFGVMVSVAASDNQIGGTGANDGNIIAGNGFSGLIIRNAGSNDNVVEGNWIGVGTDGETPIANGSHGIEVEDTAARTRIGGTAPGAGNVVSGNAVDGIYLHNVADTLIQGNFIGTDEDGTLAIGSGDDGVSLQGGTTGTVVGGTTAAERNVISANTNSGVYMEGATTIGNVVYGNYIGTDVTGTLDLGNGAGGTDSGVRFFTAGANTVGGVLAGQGNRIGFNGRFGVELDAASSGITIRGNSIFATAGIGIDLSGGSEDANSVTANDAGDADAGANALQNHPVLTRVSVTAGSVTLAGYLDSTAGADFAIDFYANASADASGYGEGETYLGSTTVSADANGRAIFRITLNAAVPVGASVSATATDLGSGNTSEFGAAFTTSASGASLWLSTEDDVPAPSGVNGLASEALRGGDVLEIGGPSLAFEPGISNGTFSHVANFNEQVVPGNGRINGLHHVGRDMTLAGGETVQAGDLLISFFSSETVVNSDTSTLAVDRADVVRFRPDVAGDYSAGTYSILLDGSQVGLTSLMGFTLVERDVTVGVGGGATSLVEGDLLLVNWHGGATPSAGADPQEIQFFRPTSLGATTSGAIWTLIDGVDFGLAAGQAFTGVDVVEVEASLGGATLQAGRILASVDGAYTLAGTPVGEHDVFVIDATTTGPSTTATVSVLLEGADLGLDVWQEDIRGLTLVNSHPVAAVPGSPASFTEDGPPVVIDAGVTLGDSDSADFAAGTLSVEITANGTANDRLAIRDQGAGAGNVTLSGSDVRYDFGGGPVVIGSFAGGGDGSTPLVVSFNASADPTAVRAVARNVTFENVSDGPSTASRTVSFTFTDGDGGASTPASQTVDVIAQNDAPTIANTATHAINDKATVDPFSTVTIGDVDAPAQSLTVTVSLDLAAKGTLTNLGGFTDLGGGVYEFNGTAAAATTAIRALSFDPTENRVTPGSNEVTTFSIQVDDGFLPVTSDSSTTVTTTSVNDAPTVANTATHAINDKATVDPFSTVTIGDVDDPAQSLTVTVSLDLAAKGTLTNLGSFTDLGGGVYEFNGTAAAATTAIRTLSFDPTENRVTPGSNEVTTFSIQVDDGFLPVTSDSSTTVTTTSVNDAPTVANTATHAINDTATVDPFSAVTIGDVDPQNVTVTVSLDLAAKGTLTNLGSFTDLGGGAYEFNGTAAAATTAIRGLSFDPTENRVAPGSNEVTTFTIQVDDGFLPVTSDSSTTVTTTSVNDAPTVANTATHAINDKATVDPFSTVTIGDVDNPAQSLTVTVSLDLAAKGTLTNLGSFTHLGGGVYEFNGTAAAATTAIRTLSFDPTENRVTPGSNEVTTFSIQVDDGFLPVTSDSSTTVTTTSVNDAPTVANTATHAINDKATVDPFSTVTIGDVDSPAQSLTVTVSLDLAAKGTLTNLGGFTDLGGGAYEFNGTAAAATTAIRGLSFDPTENRVTPGSNEVTTLTIQVDDGFLPVSSDSSTTVTTTSVNDAPTVANTATHAINDKATVDPFSTVTIGDADPHNVTVTVSLDLAAKGTLTNLGGFTDLGGGVYEFNGTAAAATTAIRGLSFDPTENRVTPGSNEVTTFTIQVDDGFLPVASDSSTTVTTTSLNDAPTVANTATHAINDKATVDPFSTVTIGDVDDPAQSLTVTVSLDLAAKGTLTNLGSFTDLGGGAYEFNGTAAAATTAIRALSFDPTENRVTPGSNEVTTFSIQVDDGFLPVTSDSSTTVTTTSVNDAPTVANTATHAINDKATVDPFSTVTIGDVDNPAQTLTVTVSLDLAAKGSLTNLGGFTDLGAGVYEFNGTAAAATTAIRGLSFDPTENRVAPGSNEVTTFTIQVADGFLPVTSDGSTTVATTSVNDAPTVANTATHAINDKATVDPFSTVTIGDVDNPAQSLTVTVSLDLAAKGTLTNLGGFTDLGGGVYEFNGTAAAATTAIRGLSFDPTENRVAPGSNEVTTFSIQVDDGFLPVTSDSSTTVTTTSVNDAPTVANTATHAINDKATVDPFSTVTIGDVDNPAQTLTVTVSLDLAAKGSLTNLGGFTDLGAGVYEFNGTAAAATTAIRGLSFDPTENRVAPGSNEVTTFTIQVADGFLPVTSDGSTTVTTTSVNDAPTVANTATHAINDKATVDPFSTVTIGDVDNPAQSLTVTVSLDLAAKGTLTNLGGFTDLGGGVYEFNGTAAAATTAIRTLTFDPTENRVAPGSNEVTTFSIQVDDGFLPVASDSSTIVTTTSVNDAPTIANTATHAINDKATVDPFSTVTIGDADPQNVTVSVSLDDAAKGTLGNLGGFSDLGGGVYEFTGSAAAATTAIRGLGFDPTENRVAPGSNEVTTFTIQVDDLLAPVASDASTTVTTTSVNDAPTIAPQSFGVAENAAAGTLVGTVVASDPDVGDPSAFSILSGNGGGAFAIDPASGVVTVANPAAIDFETMPVFNLDVEVQDTGGLSASAAIDVSLADVSETPILTDPPAPGGEPTEPPVDEPPLPEPEADPPAPDPEIEAARPPPALAAAAPTNPEFETSGSVAPELEPDARELPRHQRARLAAAPEVEVAQDGGELTISPALLDALDRLAAELSGAGEGDSTTRILVGTAEGASIAMAAGFLSWFLRGGTLVTSLLSSLPIWARIDPLPVLAGGPTGGVPVAAEDDDERRIAELLDRTRSAEPPQPRP